MNEMSECGLRVIETEKKAGLRPAPAFAEKGLATHSCNVGILCGHGCLYCSTAAVDKAAELCGGDTDKVEALLSLTVPAQTVK